MEELRRTGATMAEVEKAVRSTVPELRAALLGVQDELTTTLNQMDAQAALEMVGRRPQTPVAPATK
jgi:hypothetical protein